MHGYDVVDHRRVSDDLGGRVGLDRLAETLHRHGLGVLLDVVPNHMALVAPEHLNEPLWNVLRDGAGSPYARWFDIDWAVRGGRICLPILDGEPGAVLARGELIRDDVAGEPVIRYHGHVLPLADGTESLDLSAALDRQHWQLADWRDKADLLNYRRFFEVDTLIAVRVEDPEVFAATHAVLLDLFHAGVVDGFRIDHPDGLADPEAYLRRLSDATDGAWVLAEKILEGDETLPSSWACAGTTGYDGLHRVQDALVDPSAAADLDAVWVGLGGEPDLDAVLTAAKRQVAGTLLAPELRRLAALVARSLDDPADGAVLERALLAVLGQMRVYRAYLRPGEPVPPVSRDRLTSAGARAAGAEPELAGPIDSVIRLALDADPASPPESEFAIRFQQTCGPVMAKGVEDTGFYRWHRLVALNEVGGDPGQVEPGGPERLHAWAQRQQRDWPTGMSTLSTHDTKRSEDVRARLLAGAQDVPGWRRAAQPLLDAAGGFGVDRPTCYLLWQTLAGAWPISAERLERYLTKAMREAKQQTSHVDPDLEYERRVQELGRWALAAGPGRDRLEGWLKDVADADRATALAAKLVQLTLPGVPDVYQGCELVDRSLVDPDNRRPVDFQERRARLTRLDAGGAARDLDDEKLLVTATTLRLRAARPAVFGRSGTYAAFDGGDHVLGFVRGGAVLTLATRAPVRLAAGGGWRDRSVALPPGEWTDRFTGRLYAAGPAECSSLFATLPVALLERR
jgi:(1->4)-alpha-D-glucan 1-alpha-D-glucosylmutase